MTQYLDFQLLTFVLGEHFFGVHLHDGEVAKTRFRLRTRLVWPRKGLLRYILRSLALLIGVVCGLVALFIHGTLLVPGPVALLTTRVAR